MHARMMRRSMARLAIAPMMALALTLGGCSDEAVAPEESHTPASVKLFVNDVDVTANLVLGTNEVTRVEVRYYAADGDLITGIEDHHHTALVFDPVTLATTENVVDFNFRKDVTGQATAGTGTVMVGYGHEAAADELTFGPFPVSVVVP